MPLGTQYRIGLIQRYENMYVQCEELLKQSRFFDRCGLIGICFTAFWIVVDFRHHWRDWNFIILGGGVVLLILFGSFKFAAVLTRSQAHIFTACVDGLLNDSPFLTDDERVEVMGLAGTCARTRRLVHSHVAVKHISAPSGSHTAFSTTTIDSND